MDDTALLPHSAHNYHLYKRRWFMLAVVVMFNVSNAMVWISFAPVANFSASYFEVSETAVNWFSLVFFIAFIPCSGLSWWMIETAGFRFSVIGGTVINAIGGLVRVLGVATLHDPTKKFAVLLFGQVLCACTQPLVLSMPTKLAALWFGDHERTIANTIASMGNPLGVLIANVLATLIVSEANDIPILMYVFAAPGSLAALMAIFGFWTSAPPTPPSAAALEKPVSFFDGLRSVFKSKVFILLTVTVGAGIALFSTLTTIVQELICPQNYSNTITGVCGAMVIVGGFIGSACFGVYIDKTRNYIVVAKILTCFTALSGVAILVSSSVRHQTGFLVVSFFAFGLSGLGLLPIALELGVECTYPVDEATSAGVQWLAGQVIGAVMVILSPVGARELTKEEIERSSCTSGSSSSTLLPRDLSISTMIYACVTVVVVVLFVIFFDTDYKRLNAEQKANAGDSDSPVC